jgi:putative sterol carrier protein
VFATEGAAMDLTIVPRWTAAQFRDNLEQLWQRFDTIYDAFGAEQWNKQYGKDWTFKDQPFHMAYFDRYIVNDPIEMGLDVPESDRHVFTSMRALNDWNAEEFSRRPGDETPAASVERMRAEHERQRRLLSEMSDADLQRPAFDHFFNGAKGTVWDALVGAVVHNWGELSELRFRAGRRDAPTPAEATKLATAFYITFISTLARTDVATKPFAVAFELTGPGGGAYAIRVTDGGATVSEGPAADADLRWRLSPDDFNIVMVRQASNPMLAMVTGKIKVKGITKMGTMRKVFAEPGLDDPLPMPA